MTFGWEIDNRIYLTTPLRLYPPLLSSLCLPETIICLQDVHDSSHGGCHDLVNDKHICIAAIFVMCSNAGVLNAQALQSETVKVIGYTDQHICFKALFSHKTDDAWSGLWKMLRWSKGEVSSGLWIPLQSRNVIAQTELYQPRCQLQHG